MKNLARLSFLLITVLWGSFYAVTKGALVRIDPVVFNFFEVLVLVPVAVILLIMHWDELNSTTIKRGVILGSWLCMAMLTMSVALKFTDATNTAFFPSIGGVIGTLITCIVLKRPLQKGIWLACGLSLIGIFILLVTSGGGVEFRGDLIAFLGALFFTAYIFLVDYDRQKHHSNQSERVFWLILAIEQLTLASWSTLIALLFGDWQHFHPIFPQDVEVFLYIGLGTSFVPFVLSTFMQKYIEPLEAAFISILEPVWGVAIAYFYLGETLKPPMYLGAVFVIAGAISHTWSTSGSFLSRRGIRLSLSPLRHLKENTKISAIGYPLLLLGGGVFLLDTLGGSLSTIWSALYRLGPDLQLFLRQGLLLSAVLLCLRLFSWLIAWGALIMLGVLTCISSARSLQAAPKQKTTTKLLTKPLGVQTEPLNDPQIIIPRRRTTRNLTSTVAQRRQIERERRFSRYVEER